MSRKDELTGSCTGVEKRGSAVTQAGLASFQAPRMAAQQAPKLADDSVTSEQHVIQRTKKHSMRRQLFEVAFKLVRLVMILQLWESSTSPCGAKKQKLWKLLACTSASRVGGAKVPRRCLRAGLACVDPRQKHFEDKRLEQHHSGMMVVRK